MKKAFKRALALFLCATMLVSVGAIGASAAELKTDCGGRDHSPVVILPGINHSPTYLYDENDEPVMYNGNHIGSTLLILNEAALSAGAILKVAASALSTIAFQTNMGLDKAAYNLVSDIFKYQRCDEKGNHIENLKTQRWNYSLE